MIKKHAKISIAAMAVLAIALGLSVGLTHSNNKVDQSANAAAATGVQENDADSRTGVEEGVRLRGRNLEEDEEEEPLLEMDELQGDVEPIIGGKMLDPEVYPFLVSITYEKFVGLSPNGHGCGGTIISRNAVLTAAHCFDNNACVPNQLNGGSPTEDCTFDAAGARLNINRYDQTVDVGVTKIDICETPSADGTRPDACPAEQAYIVPHPGWSPSINGTKPGPSLNDNDYAVAILPDTCTVNSALEDIVPIALNNDPSSPAIGAQQVVIGWGNIINSAVEPPLSPYRPRVTTVNAITNQDCSPPWPRVTDNMLCLRSETGQIRGTCQGDSGGPSFELVDCGGEMGDIPVQVGVTSFGANPCVVYFKDQAVPEIHARVSAHLDWIRTTVCTATGNHAGGAQMCGPAPPVCPKSGKSGKSKSGKTAKCTKSTAGTKTSKASRDDNA